MSTDNLLNDVRDINLSYLSLMRRMIHDDRATALLHFDIDDEMADMMSSIPAPQLFRLAECNQLLCQFAPGDAAHVSALLASLRNRGQQPSRTSMLPPAHVRHPDSLAAEKRTTTRRTPYRRDRRTNDRAPGAAQQ